MEPQRPDLPPDPVIEAYKKDLDRASIRENLRRSVEERIRRVEELQRTARELRAAGTRARRTGGAGRSGAGSG